MLLPFHGNAMWDYLMATSPTVPKEPFPTDAIRPMHSIPILMSGTRAGIKRPWLSLADSLQNRGDYRRRNTRDTVSLRALMTGKHGETIRNLREKTKARVTITDGSLPERVMTITGPIEQVTETCERICETLEEIKFTSVMDLKIFGAGMKKENKRVALRQVKDKSTIDFCLNPITLRLLVPDVHCGSIIGKGGLKIKSIRELSGAFVQVAAETLPHSSDRIITVSGSAQSVSLCVYQICLIRIHLGPEDFGVPYQPQSNSPSPAVIQQTPINTLHSLIRPELSFYPQLYSPLSYFPPSCPTSFLPDGFDSIDSTSCPSTPLELCEISPPILTNNCHHHQHPITIESLYQSGALQLPLDYLLNLMEQSNLHTMTAGSSSNPFIKAGGCQHEDEVDSLSSTFQIGAYKIPRLDASRTYQLLNRQTNTTSDTAGLPTMTSPITEFHIGDELQSTSGISSLMTKPSTDLQTSPARIVDEQSHLAVLQCLVNTHINQSPTPLVAIPSYPTASTRPPPVYLTHKNEMFLPNDLIGCIIGRGGNKINEIRQTSQANIKISSGDDGLPERRITITGTLTAVQTAQNMINNSVELHKHLLALNMAMNSLVVAPAFTPRTGANFTRQCHLSPSPSSTLGNATILPSRMLSEQNMQRHINSSCFDGIGEWSNTTVSSPQQIHQLTDWHPASADQALLRQGTMSGRYSSYPPTEDTYSMSSPILSVRELQKSTKNELSGCNPIQLKQIMNLIQQLPPSSQQKWLEAFNIN